MSKLNTPTPNKTEAEEAFTLLELITVIIIIGILATLGYTQYTKVVEENRVAEAKTRIGLMRQLAHEYYLKNGSLDNIQNSDLGVDGTCTAGYYFAYLRGNYTSTWVELVAARCYVTIFERYYYYLRYYPATGQDEWYCYYYVGSKPCFGLPSGR